MTLDDFLTEFRQQPVWSRGNQRAPHKALAMLYALGQLHQGRVEIPYATGAAAIGTLLERFGPPRRHHHPSHPIWRLRPRVSRGPAPAIWRVSLLGGEPLPDQDEPPEPDLRRAGVFGLSDDAIALFTHDDAALAAAAASIADSIVPDTLRDELLDATIGDSSTSSDTTCATLPVTPAPDTLTPHRRVRTYRIQRDPRFAQDVLRAYGHRCAVCQASPRLGEDCFGLEAAHIRWVQYDGPNVVANGLCLCRMHHVALDRGAFTIDDGGRVRVSPLVDRSAQSQRLCWDHDGAALHAPTGRAHAPDPLHCDWHRNEVFRGMPSAA
jgi:putative restriction endonuclease